MICRFIDTHCHFDFPPFSGDEEASLQRAAQAGVGKIIVPATEAENFARVQALAEKYQPLYAALGEAAHEKRESVSNKIRKLKTFALQLRQLFYVCQFRLHLYVLKIFTSSRI